MHDRLSETDAALNPEALNKLLQDFRLVGVSYGHCRMRRPWGVDIPSEQSARLHVVIAGGCWLRTDRGTPVNLNAGDVAFLPKGAMHSLSDTPDRRTRPLAFFPREVIGDRTFRLDVGGDGALTLLACCNIRFDEPSLHPVFEMMPPAMVVHRAAIKDTTLPALLDAMADEVMSNRIGTATILSKLADLIVVRLIRAWIENQSYETTGWLTAIRDPNIGRALIAIHQKPGDSWSADSLAAIAGLSRSVFFERFITLTSMTPIRYLTRWRMHLASGWLRRDRISIAQVAARLGYGSEAAFSRSYKRHIGVPPSHERSVQAV